MKKRHQQISVFFFIALAVLGCEKHDDSIDSQDVDRPGTTTESLPETSENLEMVPEISKMPEPIPETSETLPEISETSETLEETSETSESLSEKLEIPESPTKTKESLPPKLDRALSKKGFNDPAAGYFHAYMLIQKAEKSADRKNSIRLIEEALGYYKAIKSQFPDWKASMVNARAEKTENALDALRNTDR
jgi:hypothetical protein